MPGHVKKSSGPDPDPSKWLFVSFDLKEKLKVLNYWLLCFPPYTLKLSPSEQAVWSEEVLLGSRQIYWGLQWRFDRVHWGGEGDSVGQGRGETIISHRNNIKSISHRKKSGRRIRLGRSILPSSTAAPTCPTWRISMTPLSCGTWESDMSMSLSTHILDSSV